MRDTEPTAGREARDEERTATDDGTRPHVAVVACGGTIASEPDDDGAAPAKSGDDLVAAVPGVERHATVSAREVCSQPGFDVRWRDVLATAAAAREAVADGADGVVVTHGTDTLADTAFALDLLTDLDAPVVVTGAQRRLDEASSDAPANLTLAVRAAADDRFAPGVHVAFDDELHAARDAVKGHSNALSTMTSPGTGPVATFTRAGSRLVREPRRGVDADPLADAIEGADRVPEVPVIHSGTGVGAGAVDRALDAGVGGLVIEGTGLGNATAAIGDAVGDALPELPVVVAGRPPAGPTEPVYGTPGGAVTLAEHGVTFAGPLPASKARIALALGLAAGLDREGADAGGGALVDLFRAPESA
ncbi:MAG: asparaginase [Halobacteriota archaeon]